MTRYTLLCLPLFFVFTSTIENQKKETFEDIRKMPTNVNLPPPASLMPKFDLKQSKRKLDFSTPLQDLKPVLQKDSTAMQTTHHADNVDIDPIEVEFVALKDSLTIDEIFELKVNIHYRPRLLTSVSPDWNGFALKVVLPNGFEQKGGDYYDFVEGNLSESNASKSYSIIGKFTDAADSLPCFRAIRSTIGARNESTFWQKQNKCFVIKKEKVEETAFDPFLENVKLMDRLKGKIEPEKDVNKNARLSAVSLTLISPAATPVYFGFCDEVKMQIVGSLTNARIQIQYNGSTSWSDLQASEFNLNTSSKELKLLRSNLGFLPRGDFKIKFSNIEGESLPIQINLQALPSLTASKSEINPGETVSFNKSVGSISISSSNLGLAKRSYINTYRTLSPYDIADFGSNNQITQSSNTFLNDEYIFQHTTENLNDNQFQKYNGYDVNNTIYLVRTNDSKTCRFVDESNSIILKANTLKIKSTKTNLCSWETAILSLENCGSGTNSWLRTHGNGSGGTEPLYNSSTYPISYNNFTGGYGKYKAECGGTFSSITINPCATLPILRANSSLNICSGGSTTLEITNCTGGTALWKNGSIDLPGYASTKTVSAAGNYTAVCSNGTSNALTVTVVATPPTPVLTALTVQLRNDTHIGVFNNCGTNANSAIWYKNGVVQTGLNSNSLTAHAGAGGTYKVQCVNATCPATGFSNEITLLEPTTTTPPATVVVSTSTPEICTATNEKATLSLTGCASTPAWYRDGAIFTSGTVVNTTNPKTMQTGSAGVYSVKCGTIASNSIRIDANGNPQSPTISADQSDFTFGEKVTFTSSLGGTVKWYNDKNQEVAQGKSVIIDQEGCYYAKISNDCGQSAKSNDVCISYRQLRITSNKTTVLPTEQASLTLLGCTSGFAYWEVNGGSIGGINPITVGAGTYKGGCEIFDGRQLPMVSITIGQSALETIVLSTNKTSAFGNEQVSLTAAGCSGGFVYWEVRGTNIWQRNITVNGFGTFKARCYYNDQTNSPWSYITINQKDAEAVVITSNKALAASNEVVQLTGTGCTGGSVNWDLKGQMQWTGPNATASITGPGEYFARCFYSDDQQGPWATITIGQAPAGTLVLVPDKTCAGTGEPIAIQANGCTQGTVTWILPSPPAGPINSFSGSMLLTEGPGTYKAYCIRRGISSPEASITICAKAWDAPKFYASKSSAVANEYVELFADNCPNNNVQWGIPKKDGAGNTYYDYSYFFKTVYVVGPGTYQVRCLEGNNQGFVNVVVHQAPGDGLYVISNKTKAKFDETVTLYAYGCSNGTVSWKFGNDNSQVGYVQTRVGPGSYFAKCIGDQSTNKDWVRVIVLPNGNIAPTLTANPLSACPTTPVTLTATGCPAGWGTQLRWINDGQQTNFDNKRNAIENAGENYGVVFGFSFDPSITKNGPRKFWGRCIKPDWSWMSDFNDAYLDVDPAIPMNFGVTGNSPITEGSFLKMAATNVFGTMVVFKWEKQVGTTWVLQPETSRIINKTAVALSEAGKYRCTVTINGACSATSEYDVFITACSDYKIKVASMVPNNYYADQLPVKLTVTDAANNPITGWTYDWFDPNQNSISETNEAIVSSLEGRYEVKISQINSPLNSCMVSGLVGNVSLHDELDHALFYLDRTPITTKVLLDRVSDDAMLKTFGTATNNTSSFDHFELAYSEMLNANFDNDTWINSDILKRFINQYINVDNQIPIGVINMRFNYIDDLAITDNLLEMRGNRLFDKPNRTRSPYLSKEVLVVSALGNKAIKQGVNKFVFPKILYYGNVSKKITNMVINFDNGESPKTIVPDGEVVVNYATDGAKKINIVVNFSDGSSSITDDRIKVKRPPNTGNPFRVSKSIDQIISATLNDFVPYGIGEEADRFPLVLGQAEIRAYYNKSYTNSVTNINDMPLSKPVIILDGFDQGDNRNLDDLYEKVLKYRKLELSQNPNSNVVENLVNDGFQVIVVNFPNYKINSENITGIKSFDGLPFQKLIDIKRDGGADYIERNARVLIELINLINKRLVDLGSTEKLTIIGPSMGGLISRYALRYMEQKGLNHNTKLWISFDSPHLGANINIGDQVLFTRIEKIPLAVANSGINQLKSVACKQLLLHHYTRLMYPNAGDNPQIIRGHDFHEKFFQDINTMGFPQNLCRVALVNGASNGVKQDNFPTLECGKTLEFFRGPRITGVLSGLYVRSTVIRASPGYNNSCDVFRQQDLLPSAPTIRRNYSVSGNGIRSSIDGLSGGYYEINDIIADGFKFIPSIVYLNNAFNRQCFIPIASSIALRNPDIDWGSNLTSKLNSTDTPFDSIFAPLTNEDHVFITPASVNFIKLKLNSTTCN